MLGRVLILVLGLVATVSANEQPAKFELQEGDRVLLIGGTFVEREGQFGYLETALTAAYPDRNITFRNLGWSGDTVWAESRGVFDAPEVGYQRLIELAKELQPTVIMLAYGQNESFAGAAGLERFLKQYQKLYDDLSPTAARFVFLTPLPLFSPDPQLPSLAIADEQRQLYADAIVQFAKRKGAIIDLGAAVQQRVQEAHEPDARLAMAPMYDGLHFTPAGYQWAAELLIHTCGLKTQPLASEELIALRRKVVEKNTLFFHRWRPQNITYLFLFRKHEQGNNAVDIPAFDELTKTADEHIAALRIALPK
jgi:lysophospholipase L1-like esterase